MSLSQRGTVSLKVHLGGAIAYVPDGKTLWALLPNALLPMPARWRQKDPDIFQARAPHVGLLMATTDMIDSAQTTGLVSAVFSQYSNGGPASSRPTAVMPLVGGTIDFDLPAGTFTLAPEVTKYFPQISEISKPHSKVHRSFMPGDAGFENKRAGLSSVFQLKTGMLTVEDYFGKPGTPETVDFAYVTSNGTGVEYANRVWKRWIANKLLWKATLPNGQRSVTVSYENWKDGSTTQYVFQAPSGTNEIDITIVHTEVEVPLLFLKDPILPQGVRGLPDPDFEMFYSLSSNIDARSRWRVPVPPAAGGAGATEKPCTGGMFAGFA